MARAITDLTNIEAPSGNFTKGRVKDNDGTQNGTPNNEKLHGDWTQFFQKLMAEAGITPNGNADDQVNNQLYDALVRTPRIWEGFTTAAQGAASYDSPNNAWILNLSTNVIAYDNDPRSNGDPIATFQKMIESPDGQSYLLVNNSQNSWRDFFALSDASYSKPIVKASTITDSSPLDFAGGDVYRITDMVTFWLIEKA
jgi:hypothetical protein